MSKPHFEYSVDEKCQFYAVSRINSSAGRRTILKAGIIGLGVGEAHISGYDAHEQCHAHAICDMDIEKLNTVGEKYPDLQRYEKAADLLRDPNIDVVSIASFDNYHYEQICQAIEYGKHIFVEKPLCLTEDEAISIRQKLNTKPNIHLTSNLILRKYPRFIELKKLIQTDQIGDIFHIEGDYNYGRLKKLTDSWRGKIDLYSVMLGGGVHIVDLFLWLTGSKVKEVAAFGNGIATRGTQFKRNDMVVAILKFENEMTGKITANFGCVYPHFHKVSVYGTKATYENNLSGATLYRTREPSVPPELLPSEYPGAFKGDLIQSFIDEILYQGKPVVSATEVFETMSVCLAIDKSVREGKNIQVNYIN